MTVDIFVPCFIDQMFPETAWSMVGLLEKAGCEVVYNERQTCCGQPLYNSGDVKHATKMAEKFLRDFPHDRPVVVPSASCAGYVIHHYGKLLGGMGYDTQVERLKSNVVELCDFLVNHLKVTDFGTEFNHTITYHDACSALREYGLKDEPRTLLSKVKGLTIKEMPRKEECCGFGGTFMVKYAGISSAMTEIKVQNAMSTGASHIVSTEASCLMNIQSYINAKKLPIKTLHIADLLNGGGR